MLNRSIAPAAGPVLSVQLPPAQIFPLPNGARLHCLQGPSQPVIKLEIIFKAGKWYEPQPGLAYLTAKMLLEGTANYNAKQIADIIAFYGASMECSQGFDRSNLTLYCLSKHLKELLPLVQEILIQPSFPQQELQLLKNRTIQNISIEKQKTSYLATAALTRNIYGANHPYLSGMDENDLAAIDREAIQAFFQKHFTLAGAEIILAGDFDEQHRQDISEIFGNLPGGPAQEAAAWPHVAAAQQGFIDMPEKLQSSIRIGRHWPLMSDPDFARLSLVNKILGGYFGSRLMKNIREEKGYTYGIFSAISPKEKDSLFYIGTDVNFEKAEETIAEVLKEIRLLREELVSEEELETVKTYTVGKFINDTATIFDQSEKYKTIVVHGLEEDYYSHYLQDIQHLSAAEIPALVEKYLPEESLKIVAVGKKA
ncbi:MAG: M16 family metallopeptidase [Adhaeribacter sp.]